VIWESIFADLVLGFAVRWERAEFYLVELLPVQRSVEISACADWFWENYSGGVDCLEDAVDVTATSDFFDEDGC
jgi:hypothetical protein